MVVRNKTFIYENFGEGLNLRDDEIKLRIGETPRAQNVEIVKKTGLEKLTGFEKVFDSLNPDIDITEFFNYTDVEGNYRYIAVAYPEILSIDPATGAFDVIYSTWINTGEPFGFEANDGLFLVDGANQPLFIEGTTVTEVTWPPSYTDANNAVGNLDQTMLATSINPTATGIGFPRFGAFHANRVFLSGDPLTPARMYASKVGTVTDFSDNDPLNFNVAFFVDIPTPRPITSLTVISNRHLVIYCDREIHLMTGENPPGTEYPQPHFNITTLNSSVGSLGPRLVASKGDNDHYFVSGNGRVFQLTLTQNFLEVKPLGLTDRIFPLLQQLKNETFTRGRLINYQLRGELIFFLPSIDQRRYPDQQLVLNYGDRPQSDVWSRNRGFGDFFLRGAAINRDTNRLILGTPRDFFLTNEGNSFNGAKIATRYQLATLNFGSADNHKEITNISIYGRSVVGATITLSHVWDNGQSGTRTFTFDPFPLSEFGTAEFGEDIFVSGSGIPFQRIDFQIANRIGKAIKILIQHESDDEDFVINSIGFDFTVLGK